METVRAGQDRPEAARRVNLTGPGIPRGIMDRSRRCRLLGVPLPHPPPGVWRSVGQDRSGLTLVL